MTNNGGNTSRFIGVKTANGSRSTFIQSIPNDELVRLPNPLMTSRQHQYLSLPALEPEFRQQPRTYKRKDANAPVKSLSFAFLVSVQDQEHKSSFAGNVK